MIFSVKLFILFILSLLVIILILTHLKNRNGNNKNNENNNNVSNETFLIRNNPDFVDGQMNFNYLVDPNYTQSILNRYYINDDTKINGQRVIFHPNQYKHIRWEFKPPGYSFYYGNIPNKGNSDVIYQTHGVRL